MTWRLLQGAQAIFTPKPAIQAASISGQDVRRNQPQCHTPFSSHISFATASSTVQDVKNRLFCLSQKKFRTLVLKLGRNIFDKLQAPYEISRVKPHFRYFSPPHPRFSRTSRRGAPPCCGSAAGRRRSIFVEREGAYLGPFCLKLREGHGDFLFFARIC